MIGAYPVVQKQLQDGRIALWQLQPLTPKQVAQNGGKQGLRDVFLGYRSKP